jgi:hypothetical protein
MGHNSVEMNLMEYHVLFQIAFLVTSKGAQTTLEWFVASVNQLMSF